MQMNDQTTAIIMNAQATIFQKMYDRLASYDVLLLALRFGNVNALRSIRANLLDRLSEREMCNSQLLTQAVLARATLARACSGRVDLFWVLFGLFLWLGS